jgi:hypothetical protein
MSKPDEHPILFSSPMINSIMAGSKTQTRRIMRYQPPGDGYTLSWLMDATSSKDRRHLDKLHWLKLDGFKVIDSDNRYFNCPYGYAGDRLWVRETWCTGIAVDSIPCVVYAADEEYRYIIAEDGGEGDPISTEAGAKAYTHPPVWKPSIFMPRWASRILLEVTSRRHERLQDITEEDAKAEGMEFHDGMGVGNSGYRHDRNHGVVYDTAKQAFYTGWEKINGKRGSWKTNPMVWVVQFKVIKGAKL